MLSISINQVGSNVYMLCSFVSIGVVLHLLIILFTSFFIAVDLKNLSGGGAV